jgi:hypothetical protein
VEWNAPHPTHLNEPILSMHPHEGQMALPLNKFKLSSDILIFKEHIILVTSN